MRSLFETYTRCSGVDDEEQKKVLGVFNDSFETYTRYRYHEKNLEDHKP